MKKINFIMIVWMLTTICCTKTDDQLNDDINFTVLPKNPTSNDNIKIIHEICGYEQFRQLTISGNSILYQREFNKAIMQPCVLKNDTINIGKLQKGSYTFTYELIDISRSSLSTDSVYFKKNLVFEIK